MWFAFVIFFMVGLAPLHAEEIRVAAAADLAPVQSTLGTAFHAQSGVTVTWVTGASGVLARQAENGAPFDVILSANESLVRDLVAKGSVTADSFAVYATGRLGFWPVNPAIRALPEIASPKVLHVAIANPAHAPYGLAARQALESQGLWKSVEPKIVYGENVRQALQFGESGNAEAVITAWTLVRNKPNVVQLPSAWHAPIRQAAGILHATKHDAAARKFLQFLGSAEGRRILREAGFSEPGSQGSNGMSK